MIFTRLARKNNAASTLALAVSIAAGGMVAASAFEAPAFAQKEKKSQCSTLEESLGTAFELLELFRVS